MPADAHPHECACCDSLAGRQPAFHSARSQPPDSAAAPQVPDVRLNIITNLHHAQDALGSERLKASVVPAMEELAVDSHWRVRHAVIQQLPLLARQLGVDFYETKLLPRHCDWLCDPVAVIREAATKVRVLRPLALCGAVWQSIDVTGTALDLCMSRHARLWWYSGHTAKLPQAEAWSSCFVA